jgi:putative multiple sugar transport system substrate-binding protein
MFSLLLSALLVCGFANIVAADMIGISMPTKSLQRWNQDGATMKELLEAAGYRVDLQFGGDNEVPVQVSQLENMISDGCKILVISAIDGNTLTTVLNDAKALGIKVIAYDRLIMNTDAISYYATFDNFKVGVLQGAFIRDQLKLDTASGPFNIELFTGGTGDNNVNFLFNGAMSILGPYIESGKLKVSSGQVTQAQAAIPGWSMERAQSRMEKLIMTNGYGPNGTRLDAVLASNDSIANGITNALIGAGYTVTHFPVITGQDCNVTSMKNMLAGTQSMSIFKDTRALAAQVVRMVDAIMKGSTPEINDTKTYHNGTGIIPTFHCDPIFCTMDNYRELLIDSGYYTQAQLAQ